MPNLQGSCRNTSRWCLQNYMENDSNWRLNWRLNEWLLKIFNQSEYLIKLCQIYREVAVIPGDGACKTTWKTVLTSELTSKWITFKNIQSIFTLISLIIFEVLNQILQNLQGSCRNTSRWCLQKYIEKRLRIDIWYDV